MKIEDEYEIQDYHLIAKKLNFDSLPFHQILVNLFNFLYLKKKNSGSETRQFQRLWAISSLIC